MEQIGVSTGAKPAGNPLEDYLANAKSDRDHIIVGDVLVGPGKVEPGGVPEPPFRRWRSAMNEVMARSDIDPTKKQEAIQALADAALQDKVDKTEIAEYLAQRNINVVAKPEPADTSVNHDPGIVKIPNPEGQKIEFSEDGVNELLNGLGELADVVKEKQSGVKALQNMADTLIGVGIPKSQIEQTLQAHGIEVKQKTSTSLESPLTPNEMMRLLNTLDRFAQHVVAGTSDASALQKYAVDLKDKGIPVEEIERRLLANGINVLRNRTTGNR